MKSISDIGTTAVYIGGIRIESLNRFEIRLTRGFEPWVFSVICSDNRLDGLKNPVSIEIVSPGKDSQSPNILALHKWHIVSKEAAAPGRVAYTIADDRWRARRAKFTGHNNVFWSTGQKWPDAGIRTCAEAARAALSGFGLGVVGMLNLGGEMLSVEIPKNLGNMESGGFACATLEEVGVKYLEPIRADIAMTPSGDVEITGRSIANSRWSLDESPLAGLKNYSMLDGAVEYKDISRQLPKSIIVQFPQRVEGVFWYDESDSFVQPRNAAFPRLQNVMMDGDGVWADFSVALSRLTRGGIRVGLADDHVRRHFKASKMFPVPMFPGGLRESDGFLEALDVAEANVRLSWRKHFRVPTSNPLLSHNCARVRLGRVNSSGGTESSGGVFCDYTLEYDRAISRESATNTPGSRLVEYDTSRSIRFSKSPFQAIWVDEREMVFGIAPLHTERSVRQAYPGLLKSPVGLSSHTQVVSDGAYISSAWSRSSPGFSALFRLAVFWNGELVIPFGQFQSRLHSVEFPAGGDADSVVTDSGGVFAIWGLSIKEPGTVSMANAAFGDGRYVLLNDGEVSKTANSVFQTIMQTYRQDVSGWAICGGTHCITDGAIMTNGPCLETIIVVGGDDEWTITTHYRFAPEFIPSRADKIDWDGVPAERVL